MGVSHSGRVQSLDEVHDLIHAAIARRRPIAAVYDGYRRLLCPHILGWNRQGRLRVLCYQYGGQSGSGLDAAIASGNWRCIALDRLSEVALLEDSWHTAANYSHRQTCVDQVEIDVEDQWKREPQKGQ
jgi:hypothetical protein